jgi:chemotaxis protein CheC
MSPEENFMALLSYPEKVTELDCLQHLFSAAIHDASLAMSRWTNNTITLSLNNVYECSPSQVYQELNLDGKPLTIVVLNLEGELGGTIVLIFTEKDGRRLASTLLETAVSDSNEWTELETSALAETGNILFCAFVDAITRLIDRPLVPSVPYLTRGCSINTIQEAMAEPAPGRDTVMICRTAFHCNRDALDWHVLFIPTIALHTEMVSAIQPYFERR